MAKLKKRNKGAVPTIEEASNNLGPNVEKETIKPMNFKVPESFYDDVRLFAFEQKISMTDVFKKSFYHYRNTVNK